VHGAPLAAFFRTVHRRVVEAPRAGAGGVEVADAVDDLVVRQVAVAEDDDVADARRAERW
jgi:hypothetical protein